MEFYLKKENKKDHKEGDDQSNKTWKHSSSKTEANALRAMFQKNAKDFKEKLIRKKNKKDNE